MRKIPYVEFKKWMLEKGITQKEIGDILGDSESRISNKLNNKKGAKLTLEDVKLLCNSYQSKGLNPEIFFKN